MATADLTVLALGRPGPSASEYLAEIQRRLAAQQRVRYRMHAMGTACSSPTTARMSSVEPSSDVPIACMRYRTRSCPASRRWIAAMLKAGSIYVNVWGPSDPAAPFGGYKASGIGREMGHANLDAYLELKTVWTSLT